MSKRKTKATESQPWKPWAKVWEDDGWHVEILRRPRQGQSDDTRRETLEDAISEASSLSEIPEGEIATG